MPDLCLYFHAHQPIRLRDFSFPDITGGVGYEDESGNMAEFRDTLASCCIPLNRSVLKLLDKYKGGLRIGCSLSGIFLEMLESESAAGLESFRLLASSGMVDFMGEDYYRSFALTFSPEDFIAQVDLHRKKIKSLFGIRPEVFRNTESAFSNGLAKELESRGFRALINETPLEGAIPGKIYRPAGCVSLNLLQTGAPAGIPPEPGQLKKLGNECAAVAVDYQCLKSRRIEALTDFIESCIGSHRMRFVPAAGINGGGPPVLNSTESPGLPGVADLALQGNYMQRDALQKLYSIRGKVRRTGVPKVSNAWRRLQLSEHFFSMETKRSPGDCPYSSPYEAYIRYMNILSDLSKSFSGGVRWRKKRTAFTSM